MTRLLSTKQGGGRGIKHLILVGFSSLALLHVAKMTRILSAVQQASNDKEARMSDEHVSSVRSNNNMTPSKHIVVAHCKEDLSWLNQLRDYDPLVCQWCHIHIYSKCGAQLDLEETIQSVSECATLHRLMNYGTEEYAYFEYIVDMYDSLPSMISFIQGGSLTENPHIIYDILGPDYLPGVTYRGLSRYVVPAWHMIDYEKVEKRAEVEIMSMSSAYLFNVSGWISSWRGMFTASGVQIRQHPWKVYAFINDKLAHGECHFQNCNWEVLFGSLFGCDEHLFEDESSCTSGVFTNLTRAVYEEDYMKDSGSVHDGVSSNYNWKQCGNKTILFSASRINGDLICLDNPNGTSAETLRHHLEELIVSDTWRADLSNQTFHKPSAWFKHKEILDDQK